MHSKRLPIIAIYCLAACMVLGTTGCGQKSARTNSAPPESTPGWNEYDMSESDDLSESDGSAESGSDMAEPSSEDFDGAAGDGNGAEGGVTSVDSEHGYAAYDPADFPDAAAGWYETDKGWYRFDGELHMLAGWQYIDGDWYYFDEDGLMAADTEVDGWHVDEDGRRQDERESGYDALTDAEKASVAASIAAENESRQAESEARAREAEQNSAAARDRSAMSKVQAATDSYKEGNTVSDTPESHVSSAAWISSSLSGSELAKGVRETADYYVVSNAAIRTAYVLSADTVEALNVKDTLDVTFNDNVYHLMVMSTGSDSSGHKTVEFKDNLLTLSYGPEGYIIDDGSDAVATVYTGDLIIAKNAEIGANSGGIYSKKSASDYIAAALKSGKLNLSGSYETDGNGLITKIAVQ